MNLNPILKKELKVSARSIKLPIMLMLYNAVLAFIGMLVLYSEFSQVSYGASISLDSLITIFIILTIIECVILGIMVPILTAGAISGEREKQTLDIMLTTCVSPYRIILGKILSSISTVIMFMISSIPVLSLAFIFGGINFRIIFEFILIIAVIALFIGSIGVLFSTLLKKTMPSVVVTLISELLLLFGIPILIYIVYMAREAQLDRIYLNTGVSQGSADIGYFFTIFLASPLGMFLKYLSNFSVDFDISTISSMVSPSFETKKIGSFILNNWLILSIVVELMFTALNIFLAGNRINPTKLSRKERKLAKVSKEME